MSRETKMREAKRILCDKLDLEVQKEAFTTQNYSEGVIPKSKEYIALLADEACVEACKHLYELGIQTINSGANLESTSMDEADAYVGINYNSLSEDNKKIADDLEQKGVISPIIRDPEQRGCFTVVLKTKFTGDMTVGEVSDKLLDFAKLFQPQDVLYGRVTKEEVKDQYFKDNGDGTYFYAIINGNISTSEVEQELDAMLQDSYYDGKKYYYESEDLLKMHMKYVKNNDKNI